MISPPLLPSSAGTMANREICMERVDAIIADCKAKGVKFTDPEWDLTTQWNPCCFVDQDAPGYDCTVAQPAGFKRLSEISDHPVLVKGGVKAGDIVQGQIG